MAGELLDSASRSLKGSNVTEFCSLGLYRRSLCDRESKRAIAVHPKPSFCFGHATLVNWAGGEVSLVQDEALGCLRHASSVRVLVHGVKSSLELA